MKEIQLRDAKATLSSVVDDALHGEVSIITRHGRKEAVIMSYEAYKRLSDVPSFGWLLIHSPLEDGDIPERKAARALSDPSF